MSSEDIDQLQAQEPLTFDPVCPEHGDWMRECGCSYNPDPADDARCMGETELRMEDEQEP